MNSSQSPLVSVVTPVYNGEAYLDECIQSVLSQTYQAWEYIILNNCSSDRTLEIAQRYAAEDSRIRVFSNRTLLPIMQNWNQALRYISPESRYCKIVHADDWLFPECVARMVAAAQAHPSAGLVGSYSLWGDRVVSDGLPAAETFFPGRTIGRLNLLNRICSFWSPSALMIRSDLIRRRDKFYNEAYLHADDEVLYEILRGSDFAFVHQVLSYIRTHADSVTSREAAPNNTIMLAHLDLLTRYGPVYLEPDEHRAHIDKTIHRYYGFLVRSVFNFREKEFWKYQYQAFKKIGYRLKISKLAYKVIGALVKSPVKNVSMLTRSLNIAFLTKKK
jgi:glycosyltransferase involved in cell wall biosynthesis